jgi:hypothetical protein
MVRAEGETRALAAAAVPLPSTAVLLGSALIGAGALARRRRA